LLPVRGAGIIPRATQKSFGAIAQLGERYNGIVEVNGSIPFGSTNIEERSSPSGWTFFFATALAILAMAGCTTTAHREASRIEGVAAADAPVIDACWRRAVASPQYQALKAKMGEHSDSPTSAMKANPQRATPQEAAQVLSLRQDYLAPCREIALESAGKVHPNIVAILAENYAKADANTAKFATYRISWGEFVSENQTLVTERRARLLAAGESMQRDLGEAHTTGAADRQRAEAALADWTRLQESLLANQRVTNCRYVGSALRCAAG
jgi:hypothetical protein